MTAPCFRSAFRVVAAALLAGASFSTLGPVPRAAAQDTPDPDSVTIPGTLQSELGCSGDWQPDCRQTALTYDPEDDVWQGAFNVGPGDDQDQRGSRYKAALNGSWGENYGASAQSNGPDIPLVVPSPVEVKFYYDHKTHWVADNFNSPIVVAMGDFQSELGCNADGDPGCLRSWMQDPDGDGVYGFVTRAIPAGDYLVELGVNEAKAELTGDLREFTVKADGDEIYFGYAPARKEFIVSAEGAPRGALDRLRAYWVSRDTIVWNVAGSPRYTYRLHFDSDGGMTLGPAGVVGGQESPLTFTNAGPGQAVLERYPHLSGYTALKLDQALLDRAPDLLKGQLAVTLYDQEGKLLDAAGLQIPGVLDEVYAYDGPLGVTFDGGAPTLRLWAPTARSVALHLFDDSTTPVETVVPMQADPATGVWRLNGAPEWQNRYYLYEVEVYVPGTGRVERNLVTDPYSLSLSLNSKRSQIVDLDDDALTPEGWKTLGKPPLAAPEDSVIYELHVRDFSMHDPVVPPALRGTFRAFTVINSSGMQHLRALAEAGLTHVHLLPVFDIASIDEDRSRWQSVDEAGLAAYPPDSGEQQAALAPIRDLDGFNWGYDPYHYTVPEGSYAADPDGPGRILEFRQMVMALNQSGLRVVMDVVYNHTSASGQSERSVLDKIVPGYYHRLNADGGVEKSTCCENTASEHAMMEKLMIDSVVAWATAYKIDGFRFDLMGHHMRADMVDVRQALDALTLARGGVDGRRIVLYGEGWDFGEVADNRRGLNASQLNIGGAGIGVFNDRLRDGARGGNPFGAPAEQGFLTGLFLAPNAAEARSPEEQKLRLLEYADWIRAGLAGNLRDYRMVNRFGSLAAAGAMTYGDAPAGYTLDPQENVVYVSAHDNETLFDAVQLKAPEAADLAGRIRMNNLGIDLVMLAQGVPFFHAGDEMLRSKSLDRNSYNSGDWFNKLDYTFESHNFGAGLPPSGDNQASWPAMQPLLANSALKPSPDQIRFAVSHFEEMLRLRKSSPLFRLQTAAQIHERLTFFNTGPDQLPGLIVMRLADTTGSDLDPAYEQIVALFNAAPGEATFSDPAFNGLELTLHPVLQASSDELVKTAHFDPAGGTFRVPGRTTAVFVTRGGSELPANAGLILGAALLAALAGLGYVLLGRRRRTAK